MGSGSSKSKNTPSSKTVQAVSGKPTQQEPTVQPSPQSTKPQQTVQPSSLNTKQTTVQPPSQSTQQQQTVEPSSPSKPTEDAKTEEIPWLQLLTQVAKEDLWNEVDRAERPPWKTYLEKAEELSSKARAEIPQDVVREILLGDLRSRHRVHNATKVTVFISSTFTDTQAERDTLMRDVYPFVRSVCQVLGLEFGTVDMRWGVTEEASNDHSVVELCEKELQRCINSSCGPAFLCIVSHKYGYRMLPAQIEKTEFETLMAYLINNNRESELVKTFYQLDKNAIELKYVLVPVPNTEKDLWWKNADEVVKLLREAATECFGENAEIAEKYFVSVTETEIKGGIFNNPKKDDQVILVQRELVNITKEANISRRLLDMKDGKVDDYAQHKVTELKKRLKKTCSDIILCSYEEAKLETCKTAVKDLCDCVCKALLDKVFEQFSKTTWFISDPLLEEISQHQVQAVDRSALFVGKEPELEAILTYIQGSSRDPLVVHGMSGCGKTSLMAVAAKQALEHVPWCALVLRFLGTTPNSGSVRAMVISVCEQISRIYDKAARKSPNAYKELELYWKECLEYGSKDLPLVLFLDSLDQLSDEDMEWMAGSLLHGGLPEYVKLIVSMLPVPCLSTLYGHLGAKQFVKVNKLLPAEGPDILSKMLAAKGRKIHDSQLSIVIEHFVGSPLPLYLRLAADLANTWHSYDTVTDEAVASDSPGMIKAIFERLENKYGAVFVHHAFAYITAAKAGLSETELEDILSCDDEVLDILFKWWKPPIRCLPKLLWARLRSDIGGYLVERGSDGAGVYRWYHRQFWETAAERYLDQPFGPDPDPFRSSAHNAIADYFEDKWVNGKMYPDKQITDSKHGIVEPKLEPRGVQGQPFKLNSASRKVNTWNKRKLYELPYHLMRLSDWDRFLTLASNLQYIEGKFAVGYGYDCYKELSQCAKQSGLEKLKQISRCIGSNLAFLQNEPSCVYQLAAQQSVSNPLQENLNAGESSDLPFAIVRSKKGESQNDCCQLTLQGHTAGIYFCDVSRNGDYIVSTSEDGSLIVWDAMTGETLVSVPLPKAEEGKWRDVSTIINPCSFSPVDDTIVCGTETGEVILLDIAGVQIKVIHTESIEVTGVKFSPTKSVLAVCCMSGKVYIWDGKLNEHLHTLQLKPTTGLDFSADGKYLAVSTTEGLAVIETTKFKIKTFRADTSGKMKQDSRSRSRSRVENHTVPVLCCAFHPSGEQIMTGSIDSHIGVWEAHSDKPAVKVEGHLAWIWSIKFSRDGQRMFTASSDRAVMIWGAAGDSWSTVTAVYGHNHRLSCLALDPSTENMLVTSSLDGTLKVWDVPSMLASKGDKQDDDTDLKFPYNTLNISPAGDQLMTSQGWGNSCLIGSTSAPEEMDMTGVATSAHKHGYVKTAEFIGDGSRIVTLDHGHKGDYVVRAALKAQVIVSSATDGGKLAYLEVCDADEDKGDNADTEDGPTAMAVGLNYIVVGTLNGAVILFDKDSYEKVKRWQVNNAESSEQPSHGSLDAEQLFNTQSEEKVQTEDEVSSVACSLQDDLVVTASRSGVTVWKASSADIQLIKGPLSTSDSKITISAFSPLGHLFCVGHESGEMSFWRVTGTDVTMATTVAMHRSVIKDMKFCKSGRYLATCGDHSIRVWEVEEGEIMMKGMFMAPVSCIVFQQENVLLAGDTAGSIHELTF